MVFSEAINVTLTEEVLRAKATEYTNDSRVKQLKTNCPVLGTILKCNFNKTYVKTDIKYVALFVKVIKTRE